MRCPPGTLLQTRALCVRLAKTDHPPDKCRAEGSVSEKEQAYHTHLKRRLWAPANLGGRQAGPGLSYAPREELVLLVKVGEQEDEDGDWAGALL